MARGRHAAPGSEYYETEPAPGPQPRRGALRSLLDRVLAWDSAAERRQLADERARLAAYQARYDAGEFDEAITDAGRPAEPWVEQLHAPHRWTELPERSLSGAIPLPPAVHERLPARRDDAEATAQLTAALAIGYLQALLLAVYAGRLSRRQALATVAAFERCLDRPRRTRLAAP